MLHIARVVVAFRNALITTTRNEPILTLQLYLFIFKATFSYVWTNCCYKIQL